MANKKGNLMNTIPRNLDGTHLRIGIVQARFTNEVGSAMLEAGALEIPLVLQSMAGTQQFDALIAIGCVIRGETYHFELVSNESASGITRTVLDYSIPIANAVLTTENDEQAHARIIEKAREAAIAAVECGNLVNLLLGEQDD